MLLLISSKNERIKGTFFYSLRREGRGFFFEERRKSVSSCTWTPTERLNCPQASEFTGANQRGSAAPEKESAPKRETPDWLCVNLIEFGTANDTSTSTSNS